MKTLREITELEQIASIAKEFGDVKIETTIEYKNQIFPIYSFSFGNDSPTAPTLVFVAGVHGLERIGTRILISYLKTMCKLLTWDTLLQDALKHCRLLFYPLVNPTGMFLKRRSNAGGIDLMRNAPIDSEARSHFKLFPGQRISRRLPWYRGKEGEAMAEEAQTLCDFIQKKVWQSEFSFSLDIHSGFGTINRVWFPYAKAHKPFAHVAEMYAFKELFDHSFPHHTYCIEPQSVQYTAHGDLWDYLYEEYQKSGQGGPFVPLSLELGSWLWVKKNPKQLLTALGAFNPIVPHRRQRTLRHHVGFFDFLLHSVASHSNWAVLSGDAKESLTEKAIQHWYGHKPSRNEAS